MVNHLRQALLEAHKRQQPMSERSFKRGDSLYWSKDGRYWMKQPDGTKVEITQGGYEDAMVLDEMPESQQHENATSKKSPKWREPHESDQALTNSLNSLADTIDETGFGVSEAQPTSEPAPEAEPTPQPTNEPESNPIKQMFPGVKSMTIQFHEDSNPLRMALLEGHVIKRPSTTDSNPLRTALLGV